MDGGRDALLEQALDMTCRMLALAEQDQWQEVIGLEARRRGVLEQAFASMEPLNEAQAEQVRRILALDKGLIEASTRVRDQLGEALEQINRGNRANHAYQANMA